MRHPDLYPLQALNGKGSIQGNTFSYVRVKVITPREHRYFVSQEFSLGVARVNTPRKRSYFLLKGESPNLGLMHAKKS